MSKSRQFLDNFIFIVSLASIEKNYRTFVRNNQTILRQVFPVNRCLLEERWQVGWYAIIIHRNTAQVCFIGYAESKNCFTPAHWAAYSENLSDSFRKHASYIFNTSFLYISAFFKKQIREELYVFITGTQNHLHKFYCTCFVQMFFYPML